MPWDKDSDLEQYKKGMTPEQKTKWIATANSAREKCIADGGETSVCDASAIKIANGTVTETFTGDIVTLSETTITKDNVVPIKIIKPGWGSSGYYSEGMLKRDGPKVFTKGLKMFWNHPSTSEETERPERDLRDLAGELTEDAVWKDSGLYGAGLYTKAKVFNQFKDAVKELTPHIGVSIRASGRVEEGEADGQEGTIIEEITNAVSVDFVTAAGAGGKILNIFESYRNPDIKEKEKEMEELKVLKEANEELIGKLDGLSAELKKANDDKKTAEDALTVATDTLAKQAEALLLKQSAEFVEAKLAKVEDLPDMTKKRLVEKLSKAPIVADGKIDEIKFGAEIDKSIVEEKEYLSSVVGSGIIKGMGESETPDEDEEDGKKMEESFIRLYKAQGMDEEKAKKLAKISGGK